MSLLLVGRVVSQLAYCIDAVDKAVSTKRRIISCTTAAAAAAAVVGDVSAETFTE